MEEMISFYTKKNINYKTKKGFYNRETIDALNYEMSFIPPFSSTQLK